jgi:DNA-binding transcriptional regulator PaaX
MVETAPAAEELAFADLALVQRALEAITVTNHPAVAAEWHALALDAIERHSPYLDHFKLPLAWARLGADLRSTSSPLLNTLAAVITRGINATADLIARSSSTIDRVARFVRR